MPNAYFDQVCQEYLQRLQARVNAQLDAQYERLIDDLQALLADVLNHPHERPWRESLRQFSDDWTARGLRITPRTLDAIARLIEEELADRVDDALAEGPSVDVSSTASDAVQLLSQPKSAATETGDAHLAEAKRDRAFLSMAQSVARKVQQRFNLSEDERIEIEFWVLNNFRRQARGEILIPPPAFYLEKLRSLEEMLDRQSSLRGLTRDEYGWSERQAKYARYWKLSPKERAKLDQELRWEQRRAYQDEHGWGATFFNPAFDGTGTFGDWLAITVGFAGAPALRPRGPSAGALASRSRGPRRGRGQSPKKPPLPPPVDKHRVTVRRGRDTPHPSHVLAAMAEAQAARTIHAQPGEVVLLWGQKIGAHGADVISYNLRTKRVTLWDVKYRSDPRRIQPSRTFAKDSSALTNAEKQAEKAIRNSSLPGPHKKAAYESLKKKTYQTQTIGAGQAKNSTIGGQP